MYLTKSDHYITVFIFSHFSMTECLSPERALSVRVSVGLSVCVCVCLSVSLYIDYLKKFLTDFNETWQDDL